jgi:hypothetical protein
MVDNVDAENIVELQLFLTRETEVYAVTASLLNKMETHKIFERNLKALHIR